MTKKTDTSDHITDEARDLLGRFPALLESALEQARELDEVARLEEEDAALVAKLAPIVGGEADAVELTKARRSLIARRRASAEQAIAADIQRAEVAAEKAAARAEREAYEARRSAELTAAIEQAKAAARSFMDASDRICSRSPSGEIALDTIARIMKGAGFQRMAGDNVASGQLDTIVAHMRWL